MLVLGAMGHAKEILDVLDKQNKLSDLYFYDDVTPQLPDKLFNTFPIIKSEAEAKKIFKTDPFFILGVGGCQTRYKFTLKMSNLGGTLYSIISNNANIGNFNVKLGQGLNVMHGAFISNDVEVGNGTLINAGCMIHHDVSIGQFCEISPGAILTGRVKIGDYTSIGAGAIIIPNIRIGSNVVIGAGAVVTKDIQERNVLAVGTPARIIKRLPPLN